LTREEDRKENNNNNNNKNYFFSSNTNPFVSTTTFWQNLMTNWLNVYGEFFKNSTKMNEYWYDIFWKPWLNWQQPQRRKDTDKVKVE
jgi:hypothetical protein